jgi:hypothetical protein
MPGVPYMDKNVYNSYVSGLYKGIVHGITVTVSGFFGQIGNFFTNVFTGNAKAAVIAGAKFDAGSIFSGTAEITSDDGLVFNTSISGVEEVSEKLQELVGSPVIIKSNGVSVTADVMEVGVISKGDDATLSIKMTGKGIKEGIDLYAGLTITASTQDGPFGTVENGSGTAGQNMREAEYYFDADRLKDILNQ